jgi:hypothetical protein
MRLSNLQVKAAKPGRHTDGKGLYLLVKPSGTKSWVLRVQVLGRRRDFGLGSTDILSLAEARHKAAEWRKVAKSGRDPAVEARRAMTGAPTFQKAAEQFIEAVKSGWKNDKHAAQWTSTLAAHAYPKIGNKPVDQIDVAAIHSALTPIWLEIPETARRVRQRIGAVLDYAHAQGWRDTDPPTHPAHHSILARDRRFRAQVVLLHGARG